MALKEFSEEAVLQFVRLFPGCTVKDLRSSYNAYTKNRETDKVFNQQLYSLQKKKKLESKKKNTNTFPCWFPIN